MANEDFDDVYSFDRTYTAGGGGANRTAAQPTAQPYGGPTGSPDMPEPSFTQPAGQAPAAQSGNDIIASTYNTSLGRTGTQDEYNAHSGGGAWGANDPRLQEQVGYIQNSPEAKTYSAVQNFQSQVQALESTNDPTQRAQQRDKLARDIYTSLKGQGHDVTWNGDQLVVDGRPYDVAGGDWAQAQGAQGGPSQGGTSVGGGWKPVDELNDLRFGDSMARMKPYTFDGFGARGGAEGQLEGLMSSLMQHPESLPPQVVDTLKAKAKDELAEMQRTRDGDLVDQSFQMGYAPDDPFFQSERNAGRRSYDSSLVGSNRDIDLAAATTNTADRRAAASLGTSYAGAQEGARQAAGSQNLSANSIAGDLALRRAGLLTQDRQFDAGYGLDLTRLQQDIGDSDFAKWILLNGGA